MIAGCGQKSPQPASSMIPLSNKTLLDSIIRLDSLVSATKVSNNQQAHDYARLALSIALRMSSEEALARAFLMMGIAYNTNNKDSSFIFYSQALKIASKYNMEGIKPKIHYNLAMIYRAASNPKMAVIFLDSSIYHAQRVHDYTILSNAYNALGNLKYDLQDNPDAKIMYDSAYKIAVRNALPKQTGVALASLSRFNKDRIASSEILKNAITILQKQPGNEEEIALIQINLGNRSLNPDTAVRFFQSAIKLARSGNYAEIEIAAYNNLAYSFMDKKDYISAEICLVKHAIPLAENSRNYDWLSSLYDTYKDVLIEENNIGKALTYEQKALKTRIKADKQMAADQVRLLAVLLDVRNKELRIQKNEKDLHAKQYRIRLIIFGYSLSILILLVGILFIIWRMQRNKIKYQAMLITSARKLLEIEEDMKGRVAMELHDLTTPFYYTMLHQIEQASIQDSDIAENLKTNVSAMAKNIREISHRMSNDFIGQLTINELVQGLCEEIRDLANVPIHCTMGQDDFNLSKEETIHIYRIIQELLTNALKYVTFGEVKLSLSVEAGMFFILYQDTGPGFDMHATTKYGLGLLNIFERAKIINGKAILNTGPGKGTKWNIVISHSGVN
jgi:two-component system, NarL family, sensor kinase